MSFCSNSNFLPTINLEELVGKSLNTINANFSLISKQVCLEDQYFKRIQPTFFSLQNRINSLSEELKGSPIAYVLFDGGGNYLYGKRILNVNKISTGTYQISFSTPINSNYILMPDASANSSSVQISIVNENANFATITSRQLDGALIDPEKISLIFIA